MAENVVNVTVENGTAKVESTGAFAPIVAKVNGKTCSVYALSTDGKPIASIIVKDKETGTETPVHVFTCAEAVVCSAGIPMQTHLNTLYGHTNDLDAHLTAGEKAEFETKAGAQEKATSAKSEAIAAASLLAEAAKSVAAEDATSKAIASRDASYRYADGIGKKLTEHQADASNPHGVTAEQVGLGNVPNKATNDLQPTYKPSDTLESLSSGEKLSVSFGKIAKAISDFIQHSANKENPHGITPSQISALSLFGGTMRGPLNMGDWLLTGIADPVMPQDAINLAFLQPRSFFRGTFKDVDLNTGSSYENGFYRITNENVSFDAMNWAYSEGGGVMLNLHGDGGQYVLQIAFSPLHNPKYRMYWYDGWTEWKYFL